MRLVSRVGQWFGQRLQFAASIRREWEDRVQRHITRWSYVFGSAPLIVLCLQIVTGILLALAYVPSAAEAWTSLQALNHETALGWFIRALHGWGSHFMVAIVLIHLIQLFLFGVYKFHRKLTWIIGVFLLLLTLANALSGQVLRFDQDAYWGLTIWASAIRRIPLAGHVMVTLVLGGPNVGSSTLSRFYVVHVVVIPWLLIAFVGLHILMAFKLGINEWPMPGRVVNRAKYLSDYYERAKKDSAPFLPPAIRKDMFFAALVLVALAACALWFGPFGPSGKPDPTMIETGPKPDYFFLWLYALLSLLPSSLEAPVLLIGPVVLMIGLLLLPLLADVEEKTWKQRIAALTVMLVAVTVGILTRLAENAPWSPQMNAWSSAPIPQQFLRDTAALERQGALVFQAKQCRNCHSLGESGGRRGPALDGVALRLTQGQLVREVMQGSRNMPAYGENLRPAETAALIAFLETLHPAGRTSPRDTLRKFSLAQ